MEQNSDYDEHELMEELDKDLDNIDIHDEYKARRKSSSRSPFHEQPLIWGAVGIVFLLSLIALFSGNGDGSVNEELGLISERLEIIENRIASLESTPIEETSLRPQVETLEKSLSGFDRSLRSLTSHTDNLQQKISRIEKELGSTKSTIKSQSTKGSQSKSAVNLSKHEVRSGDTLYSISKKYGTTIDELRRLNNLSKDQDIFPGQELIVTKPGG